MTTQTSPKLTYFVANNNNQADLMPFNFEAEEAVIGSILIDNSVLRELELNPSDFFVERLRWLYEAMIDLDDRGIGVDIVTLTDEMKRQGRLDDIGGAAYITGLISATPTSIHAEYYGKIIERDSTRRRLIMTAGEIAKFAYDTDLNEPNDIINRAYAMIDKPSSDCLTGQGKTMDEVMTDVYNIIQSDGTKNNLIKPNLANLEKLVPGFEPGQLVVLGARPSMGKTSLALQFGIEAVKQKRRVYFFSLETTAEALGLRMLSSFSRIPVPVLKGGQPAITTHLNGNQKGWNVLQKGIERLSDIQAQLTIDEDRLTFDSMRARLLRDITRNGPLDMIIIDYLTLIKYDNERENDYLSLSKVVRNLRELAKELDLTVLLLSQLNRNLENRIDKRPNLSDFRQSGEVEEAANIVLFLYRDSYYQNSDIVPINDLTELRVAKNKDGETGLALLTYDQEVFRFGDA